MSKERYEAVPFLSEEAGPSEEHDLPVDPVRPRRRYCYTTEAASAAFLSLFLAVVLIITVIAIATQKFPKTAKKSQSTLGQQILSADDLPLEAPLIPKKDNPNLHEYPRLGNVVLKTPGCGNSPEEAKGLGCVFDPMSWHWTHPECFYKDGSDYALAKGPWAYYRDSNHTEQLDFHDVHAMSTETTMYTEHSWHLQHCVYALQSVHRAAMMDKWMPEETASWPHSLHCMKVFERMETPATKLDTRVDMQFLACVKFESKED